MTRVAAPPDRDATAGADEACADAPLEPATRTPSAVLAALRAGNARYAAGVARHPHQAAPDRARLVEAQRPIAAVLACSDARVPPSVVLDQGLGDLFVVRVAGHLLGDNVLASVRYAVRHLEVPVVLVLGHEGCGAVGLALEATDPTVDGADDQVGDGTDAAWVRAIAPSARAARDACAAGAATDAHAEAVRLHAAATARTLRADPVLAPAIAAGRVWVGDAVYRLDSGGIDGLDELRAA